MDEYIVDEVLIRPAEESDTDAVARMWQQLVAYHRELDSDLPNAAVNGAERYAHGLTQRLNDSNTCTYIAEVDGQVVGYVLGVVVDFVPEMFEQEPSGFLADIFVEEPYRSQGVGRALVTALTDWFRAHKLRYFEVHVAARNPEAFKFWKDLGAREVIVRMRTDLPPLDTSSESETQHD